MLFSYLDLLIVGFGSSLITYFITDNQLWPDKRERMKNGGFKTLGFINIGKNTAFVVFFLMIVKALVVTWK